MVPGGLGDDLIQDYHHEDAFDSLIEHTPVTLQMGFPNEPDALAQQTTPSTIRSFIHTNTHTGKKRSGQMGSPQQPNSVQSGVGSSKKRVTFGLPKIKPSTPIETHTEVTSYVKKKKNQVTMDPTDEAIIALSNSMVSKTGISDADYHWGMYMASEAANMVTADKAWFKMACGILLQYTKKNGRPEGNSGVFSLKFYN